MSKPQNCLPRRNRFALSLIIGVSLMSLGAINLSAQDKDVWRLDPAHSSAQFSVRHMGISTVRGTFDKVSGEVKYDAANPAAASVDVTIDANSVDTRVSMRDNDLRSDHFLDVAKYPTITFKSKKVEADGAGKLKAIGDLTIHGVTKEVVLDVDGPSAPMADRMSGGKRIGASASTTISRKDFGVNGAQAMVGDELQIQIDVEMIQGGGHPGGQAPPPPPAQ